MNNSSQSRKDRQSTPKFKEVNPSKQRAGLHKDLAGKKVGKLLVVEKSNFRQGSAVMWVCKCDCGNTALVRTSHLTSEARNSCGCLQREKVKGHIAANRKEVGEAAFNRLIRQYKKSARERNLIFTLTTDECRKLFKQSCYYCGVEPSSVIRDKESFGEFVYNGLDRVNNALGYIDGNVVTSCLSCNERKHTMSQSEFFAHISRIINSFEKGVNLRPLLNITFPKLVEAIPGYGLPLEPGVAARNCVINRYKNDAVDRNLSFELSKEECLFLFKNNCTYCGAAPSRSYNREDLNGGFVYNGIDRVANNQGYVKNNCVSCCTRCNNWKSNWTIEKFQSWVKAVYAREKGRKESLCQ